MSVLGVVLSTVTSIRFCDQVNSGTIKPRPKSMYIIFIDVIRMYDPSFMLTTYAARYWWLQFERSSVYLK
jgi:hypothetical protein